MCGCLKDVLNIYRNVSVTIKPDQLICKQYNSVLQFIFLSASIFYLVEGVRGGGRDKPAVSAFIL